MSTRRGRTLLFEIGTEEIPARMIDGALRDLGLRLLGELESGRLLDDAGGRRETDIETFGTPRRLALRVAGVRDRQPDIEEEITGPPVKAAFDKGGNPTPAALGFARAQEVEVRELRRVATPRGECVAVRRTLVGQRAADVLARRLPELVASMTFPKMMRWGTGEFRFVRPIHWILALLDREIVDLTIADVRSGDRTRGHRILGGHPVTIGDPMTYLEILREHLVIARIEERMKRMEDTLRQSAQRFAAVIAPPPGSPAGMEGDPELLYEVTHMVEWPHVVAGEFDPSFLDLPEEVLVTAVRHHQKSFSLRGPDGRLLNRFLAIADTDRDPLEAIRKGNEWVLRARLADARFFWEEDRKTTLLQQAPALSRVTFHERLGSFAAKTDRVVRLARVVLELFDRSGRRADPALVERAARLCKADLTTQMVKEFPELEGIVGGLYARADGEAEGVVQAIYGHYLPRGASDALPATIEGSILSLADRVDTQAGIFLLGLVPTGSRDLYGLRRSVLGACRILIENGVRISLPELFDRALEAYGADAIAGGVPKEDAKRSLLEFYRGRLEHIGETAGFRQDSVRAALASSADDPHDARLRMAALDAIREDPGFVALTLAHKRIKNILKDRPVVESEATPLKEEAERALDRAIRAARPSIEAAGARSDYLQALRDIGRLGPLLDRFFDEVLVMTEDTRLRDARLHLLRSMAGLFLRVGDFSEMVVDGESAKSSLPRGRTGAQPGEVRR
jgi:glycyl-tRNA synthetase beta chain